MVDPEITLPKGLQIDLSTNTAFKCLLPPTLANTGHYQSFTSLSVVLIHKNKVRGRFEELNDGKLSILMYFPVFGSTESFLSSLSV